MAGAMRKFGKFLSGVADVAVPAAQEQQRANILAMRDDKLHKNAMAQQKAGHEFTSSENTKQREFTSGENELNRAIDEARLDLQKDQFTLESGRIDKIMELTELQIADLELDTETKQQLSQLQEAVVSAEPGEELESALERLQGFMGNEIFSPMTLYGEENDFGVQQRSSGIINRVTGGFTPMNTPSSEQQEDGEDPLGIRNRRNR